LAGSPPSDLADVLIALREKLPYLEKVVGYSHNTRKIILYVEDSEAAAKAPRVFMGVPVEVRVVGRVYALAIGVHPVYGYAVSKTSRVRPAPGGVSIGHPLITAGTLGAVVYTGGGPVILSNNHVLAAVNQGKRGDPVYQPGPIDGGGPGDTIAVLEDYIPISFDRPNITDIAIARPINARDVDLNILDIGVPTGFARASVGETVKKSGRTTCLTRSTVIDVNATIKVCYDPTCTQVAVFDDQILINQPFVQGGDSGSAVLNSANQIVGLVFAGSQYVAVANKIENVVRALNIAPPPMDITRMTGAAAVLAGLSLIALAGIPRHTK